MWKKIAGYLAVVLSVLAGIWAVLRGVKDLSGDGERAKRFGEGLADSQGRAREAEARGAEAVKLAGKLTEGVSEARVLVENVADQGARADSALSDAQRILQDIAERGK